MSGSTDVYGNAQPFTVYFYGIDGKRLGSYQISTFQVSSGNSVLSMGITSYAVTQETYFGGKRLALEDRLGSIYTRAPSQHGGNFPYGEDKGTPLANDQQKFASYWRDSVSGLDYANQRFYASTYGRFNTPDPYAGSAGTTDPGSWNRYTYVKGDPVNHHDPSGLFDDDGNPGYCDAFPDDPECYQPAPQPPPSGPAPTGPLYTWSLDVGYTPTVNLGGGRNSYDHLFIWIHPTGDSNPADGLVFDGGPTGDCISRAGCGNTTAWSSTTGHYNELTNQSAVEFFRHSTGAI